MASLLCAGGYRWEAQKQFQNIKFQLLNQQLKININNVDPSEKRNQNNKSYMNYDSLQAA